VTVAFCAVYKYSYLLTPTEKPVGIPTESAYQQTEERCGYRIFRATSGTVEDRRQYSERHTQKITVVEMKLRLSGETQTATTTIYRMCKAFPPNLNPEISLECAQAHGD